MKRHLCWLALILIFSACTKNDKTEDNNGTTPGTGTGGRQTGDLRYCKRRNKGRGRRWHYYLALTMPASNIPKEHLPVGGCYFIFLCTL